MNTKLEQLKKVTESAIKEENNKAEKILQNNSTTVKATKTQNKDKKILCVFRQQDIEAIQVAKMFILQNGASFASNSTILQAAIRSLVCNKTFLEKHNEVVAEDRRRSKI